MKVIVCVSLLALTLLSFLTPHLTTAQTDGPSAHGSYQFIMEDDLIKYVEFVARTDEQGITTGQMSFKDQAKIPDQDADDETPPSDNVPPEFFMHAEFDGLTVEKNRAVMSGIVKESSHRSYIGKWVQLVVEDNGDDIKVPDRLVWRFCRPEPGGWIPSDAERAYDDGAWMRWWATDAERKDDVGIPSKNLIPGETRGCPVFSIWSYSFADVRRWEGNIQVIP